MIAARRAFERLQPPLRALRQVHDPPVRGQPGLVFQLFGPAGHEPADLGDHLSVRVAAGGSEAHVQALRQIDAQPLDGLRLDNGTMGCHTQWSLHLPSRKCRAVPAGNTQADLSGLAHKLFDGVDLDASNAPPSPGSCRSSEGRPLSHDPVLSRQLHRKTFRRVEELEKTPQVVDVVPPLPVGGAFP